MFVSGEGFEFYVDDNKTYLPLNEVLKHFATAEAVINKMTSAQRKYLKTSPNAKRVTSFNSNQIYGLYILLQDLADILPQFKVDKPKYVNAAIDKFLTDTAPRLQEICATAVQALQEREAKEELEVKSMADEMQQMSKRVAEIKSEYLHSGRFKKQKIEKTIERLASSAGSSRYNSRLELSKPELLLGYFVLGATFDAKNIHI